MLTLLMDGRALTAKELAYGTGVSPATGTSHLQKLLADSLVVLRAQGRHKYFRLASPQVARCIESLLVIAAPAKAGEQTVHPIRRARLCYDHLAGQLGTRITQTLVARGMLKQSEREFTVTRKGAQWFRALDIDVKALSQSRRSFAHACLDWSERKEHLAGALGAALAERMIERRWLRRTPETRILSVTDAGRRALVTLLDVSV